MFYVTSITSNYKNGMAVTKEHFCTSLLYSRRKEYIKLTFLSLQSCWSAADFTDWSDSKLLHTKLHLLNICYNHSYS